MEWIKVRKKPVEVKAFQLTENIIKNWKDFGAGSRKIKQSINFPEDFIIETLEGKMRATKGDWIIKGVKGEYYPCRKDIFEETYEQLQLTREQLEWGFKLSKIPKKSEETSN